MSVDFSTTVTSCQISLVSATIHVCCRYPRYFIQMEVERRTAEAERLAQEAEINRLQEELQRFRRSQPTANGTRTQGLVGGHADTAGTLKNGGGIVGKTHDGSGVYGDAKGNTTSQHGGSSWFSPLGFLSYLFSPPPLPIKDGAPVISV